MAQQNNADEVLRAIALEALEFLLKNVNPKRVGCILITGSLANGEGTVIKHDASLIASDFDFVVYLDFSYYLRYRKHLQHLSRFMTSKLIRRNIKTHVLFLASPTIIERDIRLSNLSIYQYEFAHSSKCVFGKPLGHNLSAHPTRREALELTFTTVSDLVFSRLKRCTEIEASYLYAKRSLTNLNSLLIFHGLIAETYAKRLKIAQRLVSLEMLPISKSELKILEFFTEYKLSGSIKQLLNSLSCSDICDLLNFQRKFLVKLTIKILTHELRIFAGEKKQEPTGKDSRKTSFSKSLREYSKNSTTKLPSRSLGIALHLFWFLKRNKRMKNLFAAFVFHKQAPKTLLNVLITLLMLYNGNATAKKLLKDVFPWINSDPGIQPLQKLFYIWQSAERSLKL